MRKAVPEGIRITKAGFWYVLLTLVVGATGTNTGNSALYMVFAAMLGLLVVSGVLSQQNVRALDVRVEPPPEAFAGRPARGAIRVRNLSRLRHRWLLRVAPVTLGARGERDAGSATFVARVGPRAEIDRELDLMFRRRGRQSLHGIRVTSSFPLGFFQKGLRYRADEAILVYPELFDAESVRGQGADIAGDRASRRKGWGHELHALRPFRPGDDPRAIHWKRSARSGDLVLMERESERAERLAIVLDNAIDQLGADDARRQAFERLVSEAATLAVESLDRGIEVSLRTRDVGLGFARGARQRHAVLEALALVEARPRTAADGVDSGALLPDDERIPHVTLSIDGLGGPAQIDEVGGS